MGAHRQLVRPRRILLCCVVLGWGVALSCGGKAVLDDGAQGTNAECNSVEECCVVACNYADAAECGNSTTCECGPQFGSLGCNDAYLDFLKCSIRQLPDSVPCVDGRLTVLCSACLDEIRAVGESCDVAVECI